MGRSITIRHHERIGCIKTNNPVSAYALHILNNRHEYGSLEHTTQLLRPCNKGKLMNCWESFYIQTLQQHELLIEEQKIYEPNPLYALGDITKQIDTHSVSAGPSH
jgi:hypothetical protein